MRLIPSSCLFVFVAGVAFGQASPSAHGSPAFNATVAFNQNYDSSAGSSSEMDGDLGYNLHPHIALHAGMPYYLLQAVQQPASTTVQQPSGTTTRVSAIGDAYVSMGFDDKGKLLHYKGGLTGTVPTGNTTYGFSTGRPSAGFTNHVSHDFGPVEPFAEAGIGTGSEGLNALSESHDHSRQRAFTTLGMQSVWKAGAGVPLGNKLDLEAGMYDVLPFGPQKLYSREVSGKGTS